MIQLKCVSKGMADGWAFCLPQLPRNQPPMVTSIPELGVVSTQPRDDLLCHNDDQHQWESICSISKQLSPKPPPYDSGDAGIHVFVHPEDSLDIPGEESEEEVKLHTNKIVHSTKFKSKKNSIIPHSYCFSLCMLCSVHCMSLTPRWPLHFCINTIDLVIFPACLHSGYESFLSVIIQTH